MTLAAKLTDKQKWQHLLSSLRYSLYVIFHPFDGFWDLSREKRGTPIFAYGIDWGERKARSRPTFQYLK